VARPRPPLGIVGTALHRSAHHPVTAYETALRTLARLPVDERRSLERMFSQATKLISHTLDVERVGIWLFDDTRTRLRCACQYERGRDSYRFGDVLKREDYPRYIEALGEYRAIVADDAQSHPLTGELAATYLVPNGITSLLDAPLMRHDQVVGVVCHEHVGAPRAWTHAETGFAAAVADLVALAMEQAVHIEARRTLEEQTQRVSEEQRMASLGRVAAAVGHDFGHLLTIVLSGVQEILAVPDLPAPAATHAKVVLDAIARSRELTRQLAELGRADAAPAAPIGLDVAVGAAGDWLRAMPKHGQQIELALAAGDARVCIDPTQLDQVVMNLVGNAVDATRNGGTIRIATRVTGDDAVLTVSDDGIGIDEATRPRIFEPYFSTKREEGTGLGLAIVHALVERAGGFIQVESAPAKGTTVAIHLPIAGG
jgi:two-component system cell cycle sensor histidine kinase/response regulator CckA